MTPPTVLGLHRVAEHVLAAAQFRACGTIRLRYTPGGFETVRELPGGIRLAVVGDRLLVRSAAGTRTTQLTTLRAAGDFAGIEPGLPAGTYSPATPFVPDDDLSIDGAEAAAVADWLGLADAALRRFAGDVGADTSPVLWPEHFDLGIVVGDVNYGASLGDSEITAPYLYVGPHVPPARDGGFWNASFGAARRREDVDGVTAAVAFFRAGRDRLRGLSGFESVP